MDNDQEIHLCDSLNNDFGIIWLTELDTDTVGWQLEEHLTCENTAPAAPEGCLGGLWSN